MQLKKLQKSIDKLQSLYGDRTLYSIYGTGCIRNPRIMFVFMNPTARNVSASKKWKGLRAPWLGTKNAWQLFYKVGILPEFYFHKTQELKTKEWSAEFSAKIYKEISKKKVYITNLAKCTQLDARPLKNIVFKKYLEIMQQEIIFTNPKCIITFGNQVSSIILGKQISVSKYKNKQKETLKINRKAFNVYPVHYPVGQGRRNMYLAAKRIKAIIS